MGCLLLFLSSLVLVSAISVERNDGEVDIFSSIKKENVQNAIFKMDFPALASDDLVQYRINDFSVNNFKVQSAKILNVTDFALHMTLNDLEIGFDGAYTFDFNEFEDRNHLKGQMKSKVDISQIDVDIEIGENNQISMAYCNLVPKEMVTKLMKSTATEDLILLMLEESNITGATYEEMVCNAVERIAQELFPDVLNEEPKTI